MSLFVVVTFDLKDADASDYAFVKKKLEEFGLVNYVTTKEGKQVNLPANVYTAKFDDKDFEKSVKLRDSVDSHLREIFEERELKGKYFVFAGRNWAWRIKKV
jgi:hypothetical protein